MTDSPAQDTNIYGADAGDLYIDEHGKVWRCAGYWNCKVVCMDAVEGEPVTPTEVPPPYLHHDRKTGGVGGLMWNGFKRIHRPEKR